MRRHFSPPQLPFSSLPIPPSPPTLRIPPPSLLPLIYLIFLVLQHLLTLLLGSSFIHPLHSPSFSFSHPSSLLTLLFPVSLSFFSFSSSSCSPLSSTFVFSFFPFSSSLHHPALSIYGPVIFFFVVLLLLPALLVLLVDILIFLLFFSFSPFSPSSSCTFCSSSFNSYSSSAPTGKVGCEKLKTLCALNQFTKPGYAHINIYLGQVDPRWGKLSRGTSCPKLCGSTCPIMTLACPQ